jgi:eukaryotic-like serine/threonine-protein kinase
MTAPEAAMSEKLAPLGPEEPRTLGTYELMGKLGQGGMGTVYLGKSNTGRMVAIKVIRADVAEHEEFRERFRLEAATARRVARVCTAEVLDADPDGPWPYLVTEFIEGKTLGRYVATAGPLSAANLEQLAVGVTAALTAIHGAGIVHRDLKPGNVILSPFGPRVIDFGIARALDAVTQLTGDMQTLGTPAFMSPEQITGEQITPAADIFAWGGVVTYAATGRYPFGDGNAQALLYRALHDEPDLTGLDEPLRSIVASAMAKEPQARPTAQTLMLQLLGQPLSDAPADAEQQVTQVLRNWQLPAAPPTPPGAQPVITQGGPVTAGTGMDASQAPTSVYRGGQAPPPVGAVPPTNVVGYGAPPTAKRSNRGLFIAGGALLAVVAILAVVLIAMSGGSGGGTPTSGSAAPNAFLPRSLAPLDANTLVLAQQTGKVRKIESLTVPPGGGVGQLQSVVEGGQGIDRVLPILTPDRRTVIYTVVLPDTSIGLRAIGADGSTQVINLLTAGKASGLRIAPDSRVTMDPTGNFIVVKLLAGGGGTGGTGLYVIAIDGSSIREIPDTANATDPSWGPTGTLAFADGGPNGGHLFTIDPTDRKPTRTQLTNSSELDGDPAWSADGKQIVFRRANPANTNDSNIFVLTVGSTSPRQVTQDGARNQDPSFSAADTNTVTFTGGAGAERNLYAINLNGTGQHEIAPPGGAYFTPRWVSG